MTILLIPTEKCNYNCVYCFVPEEIRKTKAPLELDVIAIKQTLDRLWKGPHKGSQMSMHGGECTIIDKPSFERLLEAMYEKNGSSAIQTNGHLIDDRFIELFKKYKTHVGLSCDGPPHLNILRGPNPNKEKATKGYNTRFKRTVRKLLKNDIQPSIIAVLHKENIGTHEKVEEMKEWLLELNDIGVRAGRLNPMFAAPWNKQYEPTNEEVAYAWIEFYKLNVEEGLRWNPLREMMDNLLGYPVAPCTHGQCDYFTSTTVSILPDGTLSNCDRTFKDGLYTRSISKFKSGRYEALYQTQCVDCKYWPVCNAGCPAEAIDDDWRNKTRFCEATYELYAYIEKDLKGRLPNLRVISDPEFDGEAFKLMTWAYSQKPSAYGGVNLREKPCVMQPLVKGQGKSIVDGGGHGDMPHGNIPHGDG